MTESSQWRRSWRPHFPLASSGKGHGAYRCSREEALTMPLIEVNPLALQSLIVTDVDRYEVDGLATMVGLPPESWAVRSAKAVGTGHIGYALTSPVCLTDAARRGPVRLLARVETGLCDVLGGDIAYAGRLTKNPVYECEYQATLWGEDYPTYGLRELAGALDSLHALPSWDDPAPRKNSGVGRNVDVFDRTRSWSYRAIKRYWSDGRPAWGEAVEAKATYLNLDLEREGREPLPEQEIKHLARSIAKWTWQRFTPDGLAAVQSSRARKKLLYSRGQIEEALNDAS